MKLTKLMLLALSFSLVFGACKKDEEPPVVDDGFPSGIFIQFGDSTWKEGQFTSIDTGASGNDQTFMRIRLHDSIQRYLLIQIDQVALNKTYEVSDSAAGNTVARVVFALNANIPADTYIYPEGLGGTLVIKESNGEKLIEINTKIKNKIFEPEELKARVKWTPKK